MKGRPTVRGRTRQVAACLVNGYNVRASNEASIRRVYARGSFRLSRGFASTVDSAALAKLSRTLFLGKSSLLQRLPRSPWEL